MYIRVSYISGILKLCMFYMIECDPLGPYLRHNADMRNQTTISSDNVLSSIRCRAIICANAGIWLIKHMETNFREIWKKW